MTITVTFTVDSAEKLREQMQMLLGAAAIITAPVPRPPVPEPEPKRPVGRPRKVQPDPVPEIDPVDEALEEGFLSHEPTTLEKMNQSYEPNGADHDPIALEKLKQETVAKLPDMFAAGKVALMRAVLTKYGKGAKSFPEIEASEFPMIAAALARGEA